MAFDPLSLSVSTISLIGALYNFLRAQKQTQDVQAADLKTAAAHSRAECAYSVAKEAVAEAQKKVVVRVSSAEHSECQKCNRTVARYILDNTGNVMCANCDPAGFMAIQEKK